jgi:hypothetical protein
MAMSASAGLAMMNQAADTETIDSAWRGLYRVGGAAALIAAIIFRRWLGAEVALFSAQGPPSTVIDWFTLLQSNRLLGLTFLDLLDIVNYALVGLMFLGLYAALRRANRSYMTLATMLGFVGIAVYFASNQAFALLALSDQYAAATTDAQRSMFLAAGQALLTMNDFLQGGGGINLSFYLVTLAGLIIAVVMLRSSIFSKVTAYVGILANVFGLGVILTLAFAPPMTFIPLSASAPFLLIWYILIGLKLLRLARHEGTALSHPA